jgi:hypothetical protein
MTPSDLKKPSKQELFTFLKCGIPVASLAALIGFSVFMPEESDRVAAMLFSYLWSALSVVGIWLKIALKAIASFTYAVSAAAVFGFLWVCCGITNLKKKELTGGLYQKLTKAFGYLLLSSTGMTLVTFLCWAASMDESSSELDIMMSFMTITTSFIGVLIVAVMTIQSNGLNWSEIKKNGEAQGSGPCTA